jgi:choline dehydrogenase-like flavoprotein
MAEKVNAVIVGAGAAGGVVAKELAEAGLRVLLLERGPHWTKMDTVHDELRGGERGIPLSVTALPREDLEKSPRSFRYGDEAPLQVRPAGYNAFAVGGGTTFYGAASWRFHVHHFHMKSTFGQPEGTSLEDWPFSYDDLEPYYEKAEWEIGVSGGVEQDPFGPPRKKLCPVPPLPINPQGELFKRTALKMGLHPFPPPFAILTAFHNGRPPCARCPFCIGALCEVNAKSSTAVTVIPKALETGNCRLENRCISDKIVTDGRGNVIGVTYFDEENKHQFQEADLVVVSANAIESARLLLNSRNRFFPDGMANSNGLVGKNLMSHIGANSFGIFEQELPHYWGPGPSIAINDFIGGLGGGHIYNFYVHHPIGFARRRPPGAARWGLAHKEFQRRYFQRYLHLNADVQDMPQEINRVEIDPSIRDYWGIPVARVTHKFHPLDHEHSEFISAREREILKEAGAIEVWSAERRPGGFGQHQVGTCRMGNDPKTSVLNRYCQTHDIDNLFVIDASCFVSNPGHNPAFTIQAIAYWASAYIKRQWTGGAFRS